MMLTGIYKSKNVIVFLNERERRISRFLIYKETDRNSRMWIENCVMLCLNEL
jgi:hypothetical protein